MKIICILSAGVKKNPSGKWINTGWEDQDFNFGSPGGNMRIIAASMLVHKYSDRYIFVPGGRGHDVVDDEPSRPDLSDIVKEKLVELGISAERIATEHKANNTYEQLRALAEFLRERDYESVDIISNKYHFDRVKAMIETFPILEDLKGQRIRLINAEDVLLEEEKEKWEPVIEKFYNNPKMQKVSAMEADGTADIKSGKYKI